MIRGTSVSPSPAVAALHRGITFGCDLLDRLVWSPSPLGRPFIEARNPR
jgi:hypothetical protein